jgi:SAM-dependent methyltransferase
VGGGYFSLSLHGYFSDRNCKIFVVDTTQYDAWEKNAGKITFVKDSAENLSKLFAEEPVDLVFTNWVFHHFVKGSWKESYSGMADIMKQIYLILKEDGLLCITDMFYDGWPHHTLTSKIIYALTSIKFAPVAALIRKLGGHTAGVGVCFLSKKMWLELFAQAGFVVEALEHTSANLPWYQRLCFLNKSRSDDTIILRKGK